MTDFLANLIPEEQRKAALEQPLEYQTDERPVEEIFQAILPESLYMNHYELHEQFPHHTAETWRRYLKENDRFILQEVAAVTEASARQGLKRLADGRMAQGDQSAIKQLLDRSEQINLSVKDKTVYMTTFMPDPNNRQSSAMKGIAEIVKENKATIHIFYPRQMLQLRVNRNEIVENADGTAHFPNEAAITHLDRVYMHYHNPENKLVQELLDGDLDWQ